jgi:DNA polymerase-4
MEGAKSVFMRLIHRAAARLRQEGYWAQWMEVYISFSRHEEGWQARVPLGLCQDTLSVIQSFNAIWAFCPAGGQPRQVAITFLGLVSNAYAPAPLFPAEQHRVRLAQAMDRLNERLGANTIYFAGMNEALETAPTRIAFTRIPTLNDPDFEGSPARAGLVSHPPALFLLPKNIRRSRSSAEWWRH